MKGLIFLDRQHGGKPGALTDRGAWGDLNQDGKTQLEEAEAFLTARYLWFAELALMKSGFAVIPISDGWYSARHQRVNGYAAASQERPLVYVAAHLNAGAGKNGGGRYGSCIFDARSVKGKALAGHLAFALKSTCPELSAVYEQPSDSSRFENAFNCISGIFAGNAHGICFEPAFIDQPDHRELFTERGLRRIGEALALGIENHARSIV